MLRTPYERLVSVDVLLRFRPTSKVYRKMPIQPKTDVCVSVENRLSDVGRDFPEQFARYVFFDERIKREPRLHLQSLRDVPFFPAQHRKSPVFLQF